MSKFQHRVIQGLFTAFAFPELDLNLLVTFTLTTKLTGAAAASKLLA